MWDIWPHKLLSKALKSCPKSNKLPNLVTLGPTIKEELATPEKFNQIGESIQKS